VGENIRRVRLAAGVTHQGQFAGLLGVPQSAVSRWENDHYAMPDTETLIKIAAALGCSIDDLLRGIYPEYDAQRDRVRHTGTSPSPALTGVEADAATARLLEAAWEQGRRDAIAEIEGAAEAFADQIKQLTSEAAPARPALPQIGRVRRRSR
jgi:transcriptional regulator with XRE-family HTH domain